MKGLDPVLEQVKQDLVKPVPGHDPKMKEKMMAKKVEKPKGKAEKADAKPEKAKKSSKSESDTVTLADLAAEAKIGGAAARRKIRNAEMDRGDGRWAWEKGSKQLRTAREALGLK